MELAELSSVVIAVVVSVLMIARLIVHFTVPTLIVCCVIVPVLISTAIRVTHDELEFQRRIRK
jgi:hypothetical protein